MGRLAGKRGWTILLGVGGMVAAVAALGMALLSGDDQRGSAPNGQTQVGAATPQGPASVPSGSLDGQPPKDGASGSSGKDMASAKAAGSGSDDESRGGDSGARREGTDRGEISGAELVECRQALSTRDCERLASGKAPQGGSKAATEPRCQPDSGAECQEIWEQAQKQGGSAPSAPPSECPPEWSRRDCRQAEQAAKDAGLS